jgi:hypothetical protein
VNRGRSLKRWLVVLALAAGALLIASRLLRRPSAALAEAALTEQQSPSSEALPATHATVAAPPPISAPPAPAIGTPPPGLPPGKGMDRTNIFATLFDPEAEIPRIPEEVVNRWLAAGRTNAADLLAIRQVSGERKFLLQALTNYPRDPRILMAASALRDDPEAARARLDQLKQSAPSNALADYLSARNHFKNGRTEAALADLAAAAGKSGFDDYTLDANLGAEELYLAAGFSPGEAKAFGTANTLYPHLHALKGLAQNLSELEGQYVAAGDVESAARLAEYGVHLARQLTDSGGGKPLISDLTALRIVGLTLKPLPQDQRFDFLNGTPADILEQQRQTRATLTENSNYFPDFMRVAKESEVVAYFDRLKLYGEAEALRWMRTRMAGNP